MTSILLPRITVMDGLLKGPPGPQRVRAPLAFTNKMSLSMNTVGIDSKWPQRNLKHRQREHKETYNGDKKEKNNYKD